MWQYCNIHEMRRRGREGFRRGGWKEAGEGNPTGRRLDGGWAHRVFHRERVQVCFQRALISHRNFRWDLEEAIARGRFWNDSSHCGDKECLTLGVEVIEKNHETGTIAHVASVVRSLGAGREGQSHDEPHNIYIYDGGAKVAIRCFFSR